MVDLTTEQRQKVKFRVKDGRERVVAIDGAPVVGTSDETVANIVDMVDNGDKTWSGYIVAGIPGTATVTIMADGQEGEGVTEVTAFEEVTVTLDPRTGSRIAAMELDGAPEDKPLA